MRENCDSTRHGDCLAAINKYERAVRSENETMDYCCEWDKEMTLQVCHKDIIVKIGIVRSRLPLAKSKQRTAFIARMYKYSLRCCIQSRFFVIRNAFRVSAILRHPDKCPCDASDTIPTLSFIPFCSRRIFQNLGEVEVEI